VMEINEQLRAKKASNAIPTLGTQMTKQEIQQPSDNPLAELTQYGNGVHFLSNQEFSMPIASNKTNGHLTKNEYMDAKEGQDILNCSTQEFEANTIGNINKYIKEDNCLVNPNGSSAEHVMALSYVDGKICLEGTEIEFLLDQLETADPISSNISEDTNVTDLHGRELLIQNISLERSEIEMLVNQQHSTNSVSGEKNGDTRDVTDMDSNELLVQNICLERSEIKMLVNQQHPINSVSEEITGDTNVTDIYGNELLIQNTCMEVSETEILVDQPYPNDLIRGKITGDTGNITDSHGNDLVQNT